MVKLCQSETVNVSFHATQLACWAPFIHKRLSLEKWALQLQDTNSSLFMGTTTWTWHVSERWQSRNLSWLCIYLFLWHSYFPLCCLFLFFTELWNDNKAWCCLCCWDTWWVELFMTGCGFLHLFLVYKGCIRCEELQTFRAEVCISRLQLFDLKRTLT